jgi:MFS family permease
MNPWRGLKQLPKEMWIIFFTTLINRSGTMVLPFLVLYLTEVEKFTPANAGFVLFVYGLGALLQAPFSGRLSDRIGKLRILKFSLFFSGIVLFIFSFIRNYYLIYAAAFIWSIINESFRPAGLSLISEVVPQNQRKTAFALNRLAINLGMSIGPVLGGILATVNFSYLFYVDGITSVLAALYLVLSKIKEPQVIHDDSGTKTHIEGIIFKDSVFVIFILGVFPVAMIFFQHLGAMVLFVVNQLGQAPSAFGFLMAINTVLIILVEVPLNNSLSKIKDKRLLSIGSILTGVGFGLMALINNIAGMAVAIIIWTFGEMIFFPSSASYIAEISPSKRRGEYMGFYQMTFSTAFAVGPWLGTKVYESFGASTLWAGTFVIGLISFIIFYFIKERQPLRMD